MKRALILASMIAGFATPAFANSNYWADADTNKDGFISKAEHSAYGDKKFAKKDTNGDGRISKEESEAHHKKYGKENNSNLADRPLTSDETKTNSDIMDPKSGK